MLERRLASALAAFVLLPAGLDRPGPSPQTPAAHASAAVAAPAPVAQRR